VFEVWSLKECNLSVVVVRDECPCCNLNLPAEDCVSFLCAIALLRRLDREDV
jgi:hypothetical protein